MPLISAGFRIWRRMQGSAIVNKQTDCSRLLLSLSLCFFYMHTNVLLNAMNGRYFTTWTAPWKPYPHHQEECSQKLSLVKFRGCIVFHLSLAAKWKPSIVVSFDNTILREGHHHHYNHYCKCHRRLSNIHILTTKQKTLRGPKRERGYYSSTQSSS